MKSVFSIDDLISRETLDAGASKPARLAVIGHPVAHSASPGMHQPALDTLGIDARYIRLEIRPGDVATAFARMRALGFIGCNVTVPHKLEAMAACGEIHPDARSLGAVNTVRFDDDGVTRGFNTDGPGFARAIDDLFSTPLSTLRVAVLGAGGGAGQAIATTCAMHRVPHLVIVNRSADKLDALMPRLRAHAPQSEIAAATFDDPRLPGLVSACDLVVNATSVGLKPGDPPVVPAECLRTGQFVNDTIYQPAVTPLMELASSLGCHTANGLPLLLHQGILAFQHWFPGTQPDAPMRAALGL
ncbi:MAG: shikimate dehydrogenase [Luteolibacter sp.]|jgi:shikimate dehydrogenase